jgi:hypothetical protein
MNQVLVMATRTGLEPVGYRSVSALSRPVSLHINQLRQKAGCRIDTERARLDKKLDRRVSP